MKRRVYKKSIIFICLFFLLLCWPADAFAEDNGEEYSAFSVELNPERYRCIGPGDIIDETIRVKNLSNHSIRVRLHKVKNIHQSPLYNVLEARWESDPIDTYRRLDTFSGDWLQIGANDTMNLKLQLYFPSELGNVYQGQRFQAQFVFSCQEDMAPVTGDKTPMIRYVILLLICSLILWRITNARKKG